MKHLVTFLIVFFSLGAQARTADFAFVRESTDSSEGFEFFKSKSGSCEMRKIFAGTSKLLGKGKPANCVKIEERISELKKLPEVKQNCKIKLLVGSEKKKSSHCLDEKKDFKKFSEALFNIEMLTRIEH